jgi:tRNA threonylcarbamoyladenosine biosynthesis protein TsaB
VKILALDTATENCSAALWMDGGLLQREVEVERGHAALILSMINELLSQAELRLTGLDAIAFGRGPGSFTGVRLAASVTQGLAFGADLPVVPVSDLLAVAQRGLSRIPDTDAATRHILVCNDARMHEVYWGCFQQAPGGLMAPLGPERVGKPSEVKLPDTWSGTSVDGAGRGFAAYRQELETNLAQALSRIDSTLLPGATEIALLAIGEVLEGRTVAPEEAVPVYLRDDVAKASPAAPTGADRRHCP